MPQDKAHEIAYCGLYCKDCPILGCEIADIAQRLKEKLDGADFARVAKGLSELSQFIPEAAALCQYPAFHKVLGVIASQARCEKCCKDGGGSGRCQIRICCVEKKFDGCWQCGEFETCPKLMFLDHVHQRRHVRNLAIIRDKGVEIFLKGPKEW